MNNNDHIYSLTCKKCLLPCSLPIYGLYDKKNYICNVCFNEDYTKYLREHNIRSKKRESYIYKQTII